MTDEIAIRELITRWAEAVHSGNLDGVLADHDSDIVMFDVPPPYEGVRGIDAYRESWPPFFEWQRQGAVFEIVELAVTAGTDVAFAYALLRCGKPEELEANPTDDHRPAEGGRALDRCARASFVPAFRLGDKLSRRSRD